MLSMVRLFPFTFHRHANKSNVTIERSLSAPKIFQLQDNVLGGINYFDGSLFLRI